MGSHRTSRVTLIAAAFAVSVLPFESALSADSRTTLVVDIDPQPLETALVELCKQGHLQLVISSGSLPARMSMPLHGSLRLGVALDSLLKDTGLTYKFVGRNTIAIVRPAGPGRQPESSASLVSGVAGAATPVEAGAGRAGDDIANRREDLAGGHHRFLSRLATFLGACTAEPGSRTACAQQADAADRVESLREVIVTGSRVITNGNDSPTPVTVMTARELQDFHSTAFEALIDLPVFAGSRGAALSNPGQAGGNNANVSALSLRGLNAIRTLVLYDGHRLPPTQQDGATDANIAPQMLLQRVDVVTGGASAVYGSDAIGGVVNFIADRKFQGVKISVQSGISELRDDRSYNFGVAGGTILFDGRGHIEGSYQVNDDAGIPHRNDRKNFISRWTVQGNGCPAGVTPCAPYFLVANATVSNLSFGGKITGPASNPLANYNFSTNGVLTPFVNGDSTGIVGNQQIGGDGSYHTASGLKAKVAVNQVFGRFDLDLTDTLHYYAAVTAMVEHEFNYFFSNNISGFTVSATNAFLAPAYQQQMTAAGLSIFTFGKTWGYSGVPPVQTEFFTRHLNIVTGLEGRLGGYRWDLAYSRSDAKLESRADVNINLARLSAALDAVTDPATSKIVCRVALTNPGLYPGCVPVNVFGPTAENSEAINYFVQQTEIPTRTKMDDVSATLAGAPLDDWAGPVNMALSGEWRRLGYELTSTSLPVLYDPVDCTGLRYNCTTFNPASGAGTSRYQFNTANRPPVSMTVAEAAVEADVPLLRDLPLARSADLNLAYRYTRYRVSGSPIISLPSETHEFLANTWKVGLNWHLRDALTLRATRSRDIRAPNLNELFQPGSLGAPNNITDYLTNITPAATTTQSGGNPDLGPETAFTTTVGIVYQPTAQFSLAVDAYDIKISNVIITASGQNLNTQRACYASGGSSPYCQLIERPFSISNTSAANVATRYYSLPINVALLKAQGADVEANYRMRWFNQPLSLRALLTYQPHTVTVQDGFTTVDASGTITGAAVWRVTAFAHYRPTDRVSIDWMTRWRSRLHMSSDPTLVELVPIRASSVMFSNLNLAYRLLQQRGQVDINLGIQNVFNQLPPITSTAATANLPGNTGGYVLGDDPVGRYYSLGVRYRM
jgi:outer membrane receptor protein involved in Fe transport